MCALSVGVLECVYDVFMRLRGMASYNRFLNKMLYKFMYLYCHVV